MLSQQVGTIVHVLSMVNSEVILKLQVVLLAEKLQQIDMERKNRRALAKS